MKKRPDTNVETDAVKRTPFGGVPALRWKNPLGNVRQQLRRVVGDAYVVLHDLTGTSEDSAKAGSAAKRQPINRPVMPSETIDDDVSTASVFVVAILLMVLVTVAIFFMITSGMPVFSVR